MLRWHKASTSPSNVEAYFIERRRRDGIADYYLVEEEQGIGYWGGRGANRLGLEGKITHDTFRALCRNQHPQRPDESLTSRNKVGRRVGWDVTFSPPKSVSLTWTVTRDERIVDAMRQAAEQTMAWMEGHAAVRVRKRGADSNRQTGNAVWATFMHYTSRPTQDGAVPDPQLHCHAFVFNASYDETEGVWKALQNGTMRSRARYYEAVFHSKLSDSLKALGYPIERRGDAGWEIATVSRDLIERFSSRKRQIEAKAKELGLTNPNKIAELAGMTQAKKARNVTLDQLHELWGEKLTADESKAITDVSEVEGAPAITPSRAMNHAMTHCFERESVVEDWKLKEAALRFSMGSVTPEQINKAFREVNWLSHTDEDNRLWVTTKQVLENEQWLIQHAREGRGTCLPLGDPDRVIPPRRVGHQLIHLNAEQQAAVRHIWSSFDKTIAIYGVAGVGKTTLLQEAARGISKKVAALAPSAEASRGVLREAGFKDANTIEMFLSNPKMQEKARDQVILVDEASLVGTRTMIRLLRQAEKLNARTVLVGDTRQHHAVERGDAMRVLEKYGGIVPAEVSYILRQEGIYKEAVQKLSRGEVDRGFDKLEAMNAVYEIEDPGQRYKQLARDYVEAVNRGKSALVVSPTHGEGKEVTDAIRQRLKDQKIIDAEHKKDYVYQRDLQWTAAQKSNPAMYEPGQTVWFNTSVKGFQAGNRAQVVAQNGKDVHVLDHKGRQQLLPLGRVDRFTVHQPEKIELCRNDLVRCTNNTRSERQPTPTGMKSRRLNNGTLYRVRGFAKRTGNLILEPVTGQGKAFEVKADNGFFNHGYCSTSHAAQGRTVQEVFIAQGSGSGRAASLEQFYVSVSRGKDRVRIYTDDRAEMRESIRQSAARDSAIELAERSGKEVRLDKARRLHHIRVVDRWRKVRNKAIEIAWTTRRKLRELDRTKHWRIRQDRGLGYDYQR